MLKICVLGYPEVYRNGELIEKFMSNKVVVLLCYLVLNPQTHARERLASLLWGDMPDSKAKSNLRQALHDLGKSLGNYLDVSRQSAGMRQEMDIHVDALTLRDVAADLAVSPDELARVVAYYRGGFLEGINLDVEGELDDWLRTERESLRLVYLDVLERLSQHQMNMGDWANVKATLLKSLQVEPLRETTHRRLMLALARQGRYEEAITQYNVCQETLDRELGLLPSEETLSLYSRIRHARNRPTDFVPVPTYTFIGRDDDLRQLDRLLRTPLPRLVTVTGEGGVGKTRLAVQAIQPLAHQYLDGIVFVSLEGAPDLVVGIAEVLIQRGYIHRSDGDDELETLLLNRLRDQEMLLVLDNLEHLVDQYEFVIRLLEAAPDVKILVTSRVVLNIRPEHIIRLEGLTYPALIDAPDWQQYDAPALFLQTAARNAFAMSPGDRDPITAICSFVQGVPLAIELAATHAGQYDCTVILTQLKARYDALIATMRDVPQRQVSMRATFDYSWDLLNDAEQTTLSRLSVFSGATSRTAIKAVTQADTSTIDSLVNQSLLRQIDDETFAMHELLRQYASELLEERGEMAAVQDRHARFYLESLKDSYSALNSDGAGDFMAVMMVEIDNIQAAWRTGVRKMDQFAADLDVARETMRVIYDRNGLGLIGTDVFLDTADVALAHDYPRLAAHCRLAGAFFYFRTGRPTQSQAIIDGVLAANETLKDPEIAVSAHCNGIEAAMLLDVADQAHDDEAGIIRFIDQVTNPGLKSRANTVLGFQKMLQGQLDVAADYHQKALAIARDAGLRSHEATARGNVGTAIGFTDPDEAAKNFREALAINEAMGDKPGMATAYNNLAIYGRVTGDRALQEECLSRAATLMEENNDDSRAALLQYEIAAAHYEWGEYEQTIAHYRAGLNYYIQIGSVGRQCLGMCRMGHALRMLGERERARNYYRQAAELGIEAEYPSLFIEIVVGVAGMEDDPTTAAEWLGAARHQLSRLARIDRLEPYIEPVEAALKEQLPADEYEAALMRGQHLDLQDILATALLKSESAA